MKFNSYLTEATYLKRTLGFLTEVALKNKRTLIVRSPSLKSLPDCEILGTKVWFSAASGSNYLPTWEVAEVDFGHLVCVNPNHVKPTFSEAVRNNVIKELIGYRPFTGVCAYETLKSPLIFLQKKNSSCFVGLDHIAECNEQGECKIDSKNNLSIELLEKLIKAKAEGHRAILCFCVFNTKARCIKMPSEPLPKYKQLIETALNNGIEVIAYKASISTEEISLSSAIPSILSQNSVTSS